MGDLATNTAIFGENNGILVDNITWAYGFNYL